MKMFKNILTRKVVIWYHTIDKESCQYDKKNSQEVKNVIMQPFKRTSC